MSNSNIHYRYTYQYERTANNINLCILLCSLLTILYMLKKLNNLVLTKRTCHIITFVDNLENINTFTVHIMAFGKHFRVDFGQSCL